MAKKTLDKVVSEFKKGKVYSVDAMEDVPKWAFPDYFDQDVELDTEEYESGSALCSKSFTMTITIQIPC